MKVPKPRKLKSGNYFIYLRLGGETLSITRPTAKECTRAAELVKAQYRASNGPISQPSSDKTLKNLMQDYIDKYSPVLSPATIRGYDSIKKNRFKKYADIPVKNIKNWQEVINTEAELCAPKTLKNAWSFLNAAMQNAKLPKQNVTLPSAVPSEHPWLDTDEVIKMVQLAKKSKYAIPILLGLHGLRRSEICALTWDDIDLKSKRISVNKAMVPDKNNNYVIKNKAKTSKGNRVVPIMIPDLLEELNAVPKQDRNGAVVKCHINTLYKVTNRICKENGFDLIGAHGLRHSFASVGHAQGVPIPEMQLLGGWDDAATLQKIYTHIAEKEKLKAENAISAFFNSSKT